MHEDLLLFLNQKLFASMLQIKSIFFFIRNVVANILKGRCLKD